MPQLVCKAATLIFLSMIAFSLVPIGSAQDDAELYYRRTHDGELPPAGVDGSDHSGETSGESPAPAFVPVKGPALSSLLDSGINPADLGKGDWIWQIPTSISVLGAGSVQGLIDYEQSRGMKWITVKCGDGGNIWTQFNTDLITRARAAGLKIFGWSYVYGNNVQGEINVALNALSLGADGFIIDAESEYETLANNNVAASNYCAAIKAAYPNRFLAHAPFPIISSHSGFPYIMFGKFCDAVMPQAYWADIGGTNYAVTMVTRMNNEWRNWQNSLTGQNTNAIKPIVPIGQAYNSVNGTVTGTQISLFVNAMKTNSPSATAGGYKGVSFWSCQHHTVDMWNAIGAIQIGTPFDVPSIITNPANRAVDAGASVTFAASAVGAAPLRFQWRFNGANIPTATNTTFTRANLHPTNSGNYDVVVTNTSGAATSTVARLLVNPTSIWQTVFSDPFENNSSANWSLFQDSGNGTADYTAEWAFDYGTTPFVSGGVTNFIPPAPNSVGTTRGLKLTVNKNDLVASLSGVSLYPNNQTFSGDYILRCDVWLNYNGPAGGSAGSTEFASLGINHAGTRVNWGGGTSTASDGLWFAMDGEGGTTSDFRAYEGRASAAPALLSFANSGLDANGAQSGDSLDPFFQTQFPAGTYESAGAPGKRWTQCEVSQINGMVLWRLNGVIVAERTNTTSFTNGNVMIGYMDLFTSIPSATNETFVIFDNVRVLTPVMPPVIITQPTNRIVNAGANASFAVVTSGSLPQTFQWRCNGTNVSGATNRSLMLSNVMVGQAGNYSVIASNAAGTAMSSNATLAVTTIQLGQLTPTNGAWLLSFSGAPGTGYVVETSIDLVTWQLMAALTNFTGVVSYLIPATNAPHRFFRISETQ
ncbi:MAG TPA: immunoglobulin domain-containing protein [Candidatus Limnocylindria bacterium]|nr:immunoglobulin domain-containing protein [Candidatus Limnocylindria bacterium]